MGAITFDTSAIFAAEMDARNPLAGFRQQFHIPPGPDGSPSVYLCGHSLGLQAKPARAYLEQELEAWAMLGVEAHFRGRHAWMPYHRLLTDDKAGVIGERTRSCGHEFAHGEPAPDDGVVLPSHGKASQARGRGRSLPFRPVRLLIADSISWVRSRDLSDRAHAARGRGEHPPGRHRCVAGT